MGSFTKTVITGFAFSLGAALFRKVAPKLGLDDSSRNKDPERAEAAENLGTRSARQPVEAT